MTNEVERGDQVCNDADGCPTETAVLKREWRRLSLALKMAYCQKVGADDPTGLDCCDNYRDWLTTLTPNVKLTSPPTTAGTTE